MSIEIKRWTDGEVIYTAEYAEDVWEALEEAVAESANLGSADLGSAKGIHPARVTPLHILLDQVGKIRAYKLVNADGEGPFNGGITYEVGKTVEVEDADTDPANHCGAGINVATLPWCIDNWQEDYKVLLVEFTRADIACIPTATDGKFRVRRCKVVREVDVTEIVCPEEGTDA